MAGTNDFTGEELLKLANSSNTRQFKDVPLDELAEWISDQNLTADVLMISLLSDIYSRLNDLDKIKDLLKQNNKLLQKMYE
jgi:hypothetical protein